MKRQITPAQRTSRPRPAEERVPAAPTDDGTVVPEVVFPPDSAQAERSPMALFWIISVLVLAGAVWAMYALLPHVF